MSLAAMLDTDAGPRRRPGGRPPASDSSAERERQILAVLRWKMAGVPIADVAAEFGVSTRTVKRWARLAEGYDAPGTVLIRALARRGRRTT